MENGENYYLHSRSTKPKKLKAWQGQAGRLESIAWDKWYGREASTKSILVGDNQGHLFETALEHNSTKERPLNRVRKPCPVTLMLTSRGTARRSHIPQSPHFPLLVETPPLADRHFRALSPDVQVYDFEHSLPILGLEFELLNSPSDPEPRILVLAATCNPVRDPYLCYIVIMSTKGLGAGMIS